MAYRRDSSNLYGAPDAYETEREGQISKVSLFGIAIIVMLACIAATASSSHSAVKAAPQIDPLSLMAR